MLIDFNGGFVKVNIICQYFEELYSIRLNLTFLLILLFQKFLYLFFTYLTDKFDYIYYIEYFDYVGIF